MAKQTNLCAILQFGFILCALNLSAVPTITSVSGSNVLAVFPSVWQSHYLFGRRLLQQLVEQQNHTVTLISPYCNGGQNVVEENEERREGSSELLPKIREIHIDNLLDNWIDMGLSFDVEQAHQQSMLERFTRLIYAGTANVDLLLSNANVRKLLRSDEQFDLLIIDLFLSDALLGLAFYYKLPTVVISPNGANTWLNRMIGNPQSSALDPSNFLPYTERMSLWERCANTLMGLFEKLTYNFFHMISQQAVYVKHFQPLHQRAFNRTVLLPHHRDLTQNLSLILLNSQPVVQYPRAFLPNVLPVGGLHLQAEQLELPNHLKSFIETARRGVVFISLGADARTVDLAHEKVHALFDVISYMEEINFLLKWETDEYPKELPENVLVNAWFPQEAILAHSNVKIFISTCGLMSVFEAINGLTPMLAIPIYPEQIVTANRLQAYGLAVIVPFDAITYETLLNNIQELLTNSSYQSQQQSAHALLKLDYGTPSSKTLHYIDLILRTGGADHLKTHAHHLNFLRSKLFDVLAIIALGLGGILAIPFLLICCILKRSYYNQKFIEAATAAASGTAISQLRSKVSMISSRTATERTSANSGKISPKTAKNLAATITAVPLSSTSTSSTSLSFQDGTADITKRKISRRLSTSALWTANMVSSNVSTPSQASETISSTSSSNSLYAATSHGSLNNVYITKST